jgi:acyl transferase domain-containing protein
MLSAEGRCKFGDATADGYVRGEGAAALVLKPLSRALSDGDPICALIRGTGVNSDGRGSGLLVAPSSVAHQDVFRAALRSAGVSADRIDYIEAHGTGTRRGDPVELGAIGAVLASTGRRARPCLIGSVKTNIGHTEAVSGLAGLIKTALALQHKTIPASLHFHNANPDIPWQDLPLEVITRTVPWPSTPHTPMAGVNSFGITGTNAHVILEAAPAAVESSEPSDVRPHLLNLSAQHPQALRDLAQDWRLRLAGGELESIPFSDICYTASARRTHHDFRLALTAREAGDAAHQLADWLEAGECEGVSTGRRNPQAGKLAFVFPGQGGQWTGMGRSLLRREPVFREAMEACDGAIRPLTRWSVIERLTLDGEAARLQEIDTIQPILFAFQVSLAELWRGWGLGPQAVAGHSMGEVAAAVVAGILSLEDGAAVICNRSRLMRRVSGLGLMALTSLNADDASALASNYPGRVSVAAFNSPSCTVLSGDTGAIEELLGELTARQVFCRRIKVDVASHSPQMEPLAAEMARAVSAIQPRRGALPLYSTTSGQIEDGTALGAEHWGRNLRQPVLFASTVQRLIADGFNTFLEIGPHPVLLSSVEETIAAGGHAALCVGSLRREQDESGELLAALGRLYAAGCPVEFGRVFPRGRCVSLPNYPFQRERYWVETDSGRKRDFASSVVSAKSPAAASSAAEHLYELRWTPAPDLLAASGSAVKGLWILLDNGTEACDRLAAELAIRGQACARVYRGATFQVRARLQYEVNPGCAEDLDSALSECATEARGPIAGVIHTWAMSSEGAPSDLSEVWAAQESGCFSAMHVVQALVRRAFSPVPRLWLVTADAAGPGGQAGFAQGALWGLGAVASQEHPELACTVVDIGEAGAGELRSLASLVCAGPNEGRVVLRGSECLVARYQHCRETAVASPALTADGTYLITGGTGGIGPLVAGWMVERGARNIALVARRPASAETRAAFEHLQAAGANVHFIAADIAEPAQVATAVAQVREALPPLRGICHLAATSEATLLRDCNEAQFRRVLSAKMAGAWNLHMATRDQPLDFFVLFSSLAAVVSQPGLASYAAGNAFLDALAGYRRAQGLPALSLEFGPWANLGLARAERSESGVRAYERLGISSLTPEMALDGLGRAMAGAATSLMLAPVAWERFAGAMGDDAWAQPFSDLTAPVQQKVQAAAEPMLGERLLALASRQRRAALETFLREQLARIIKMPASRIDIQTPMGALGMDSLMGLEFVRRLASATSVRLPATAVFNYPTIQLLSAEIAHRMGISIEDKEPEPGREAAATAAGSASAGWEVASMSDEDAIRAMLGEKDGLR